MLRWLSFAVSLLLLSSHFLLYAQQPTIEDVLIQGNRRVPEDTIKFYLQVKPGDTYDEERIRADFQALVRLKSFKDVQVEEKEGTKGKVIVWHVEEWPLIRSIEYVGNKSFSQSDILEHFKNKKVGLTVDSQFDPGKINLAERSLKELLDKNGKPMGTVRHEVENVTPTSVKLKFIIEEGPKVRIGQITFTGNKVFSDSKLRDALKLTKERGIISAVRGRDKYDPLKLEADLDQNVRKLYQEYGYINVRIGTPKVEVKEGPRGVMPVFGKTKEQFFIEIPIVEGDQYRLGELHIKDSKVFKEEVLLPVFGLKKGDVVNFTKIRDGLEKIRQLYGTMGYINFSYLPEENRDEAKRTLDLTFVFQEDKQYRVGHIEFAGNTRTRDKVLRREMLLDEKDVFNSKLLELSVLRLNQLGFFEKIEEKDYEVKPNPDTSEVDVAVKVKERGQQSIGFTGGTSGISGSFVGITYTSNNFRGKGQRIEADITAGTRTTNFLFAFTDPYFRDSRVTLGFSVFNQRLRFDTFNTFGTTSFTTGKPFELFTRNTTGIQLSASYPLWGWWRLGASYTIQNISIPRGSIAPGLEPFALGSLTGFTPGGSIEAALKGIKRSQITPSLLYNTTNHPLDPTRGQSLSLSFDVAGGPLRGNFNLLRPNIEYRYFHPDRWLSKGRNTLALRALVGYVTGFSGTPIPLFDRYFSGGENLIRGFDIRSVGPYALITTPKVDRAGNPEVDPITGQQRVDFGVNPIGGDTLLNGNFEYRIPIAGPLAVGAFFDVGTARISRVSQIGRSFGTSVVTLLPNTNTVWRTSTGAEILFQLPVVYVPFRLIFAYNPSRFDEFVNFFNRSTRFTEPRKNIQFTVGRAF